MGQGTEQDFSGLGVGLLVVIAVLSLAAFVLWVAAIISVARDSRLTGGGKLLWIANITPHIQTVDIAAWNALWGASLPSASTRVALPPFCTHCVEWAG